MVEISRGNTTLRMGVPLALLGTLTGIAVADAQPDGLTARAAATGGGGAGKLLLSDFKRGQLEKRFFTHAQADKRYLKISTANDKWLKISTANDKWLKIDDANVKFLKIEDANNKFLKIDDAYGKFLKIDGAAADSNKLGGMTASQFVQGRAAVLVGRASSPPSTGGTFLTMPGMASVEAVPDSNAQGKVPTSHLRINALGDGSVRVVATINGQVFEGVATAGAPFDITGILIGLNQPAVGMIQLFTGDGRVTTANVSASDSATQGNLDWVGQAVAGQ